MYHICTNNPNKAFSAVAGHEITHLLRERISDSAWANFENYAVKVMGGDAAVREKQAFNKKYAKAETAREEVACGFVGKLLSDKKTLQDFCYAVEHKQVRSETVKWLINACKWCVGKFTNRPKKGEAALIDTVKNVFGTDIETATEAIKALQTAYQEATRSDVLKKNTTAEGGVKHSFKGYDAESGRGIYESNFPKGTPKSAKAAAILDYIQNVWSKKPIDLVIKKPDGTTKEIQARFDPTYDPSPHSRTDASKLMGGNRHGTSSDQRVTLDLASDYYQIASESTYNYSKAEEGKTSAPHNDVRQWHYFINDILFHEYRENTGKPYRVTINVKEKSNGSFVYSFSAELQKNEGMSTRQTLHADVTPTENSGGNAHSNIDSIAEQKKKSNTYFAGIEDKKMKADTKTRGVVRTTDTEYLAAVERDDMDTAQRMVDEAANEELSSSADDPDIRYDKKGSSDKAQSGDKSRWKERHEWKIKDAVTDAVDHGDAYNNDNLIEVGEIPPHITEMTGVTGQFYVYRDHLYENIASEEQAIREHRKTMRKGKKIHFHSLGEERVTEALQSLNAPLITIGEMGTDGNPQLWMMLPVDDAEGKPIYAAFGLYENLRINGKYTTKPHVVLTISPISTGKTDVNRGRSVDLIIQNAVKKGTILDIKNRDDHAVTAQPYTLGGVSQSSLGKNISRFKQFVNEFKERNKIKYSKKSLTDGDVFSTEDGKQAYAERYGMQLETEGQAQRAAARDVQRADEAKQKAQSAEVAKEAEALLEEKMQKAAEDKLEERRKKYFTPPKKQKASDLSEMSREDLQAGLVKVEKDLRLERLKKETAQSQLKRTNGSKTDPTGVYVLKIAGTVLLL